MRRLFVICLILLLPRNMFALAMAASAMQPAEATVHATPSTSILHATAADAPPSLFADAYLAGAYDCQVACDIDPDEPPAGADVHDSVNEEAGLLLADFPRMTIAPVVAPRPSHSSFPPLKPPRLS